MLASRVLYVVFAILLSGCSSSPKDRVRIFRAPYRVEVTQGNFISKELAESNLRIGADEQAIRRLFGPPSFQDMFHPGRWDYTFYVREKENDVVLKQHLVLHFKNGKLIKWSSVEKLIDESELVKLIDND